MRTFIYESTILLLLASNLSICQTITHKYELVVVDPDGKPIKGANVDYAIEDQYTTVGKEKQTTDEYGRIQVSVVGTINKVGESGQWVHTQLDYTISKDGYFSETGVALSDYGSTYAEQKEPIKVKQITLEPRTLVHKYELIVADINKLPVGEASIEYTLSVRHDTLKHATFVTTENGKLLDSVVASPDPELTAARIYRSTLKYEISKSGFYPRTGYISSTFGGIHSSGQNPKIEVVTLTKPTDYLEPNFAFSKQGSSLRNRILKFIDLIRLQSLLADALLDYHSIDVVAFKNKKYLKLKFVTSNTYNSLKLDKYDIAKRLFDEVVRKVLNPLNDFISDPKIFFGYDLTVIGYTKDFSNEYASSKSIEYRFLIPGSTTKKYKNKDISGQQLIDGSIILMDDERIDLKLQ